MSSLWILYIAFLVSFGLGMSEICKSDFYITNSDKFTIVRIRYLEVVLHAPRNRSNTGFCELTRDHQHSICDGFKQLNWSWPARLDIRCDIHGYDLHVSRPLETLLHCSGQIIHYLTIHNCSVSWRDMFQLARFTEPYGISLTDVPLRVEPNISKMTTVHNSSFHVRTSTINVDSTTTYPSGLTTAELFSTNLINQELGRSCIDCQIKNHKDTVQYQLSITKFPKLIFAMVKYVRFSDINLTAVSDLRGFGEIHTLQIINCGLKSFPLWMITKTRQRLNLSLFEKTLEDAMDKLSKIREIVPPDSPLLYKDHPIWHTVFSRLSKQYYTITVDLSMNSIREVPYLEGMERLDVIFLSFNYLHGSRISNLSFATNILKLDLSFNPLEYLPDNLFDGYTQLETLQLIQCNLSSLQSILNQDLKTLKFLFVYSNHITYVPKEVFFLPSLLLLNVNLNNLSNLTFPPTPFTSPLFFVTLYFNQLRTFPAELLTTSFPSMGDIRLMANELTSESMALMVQLDRDRIRSGERGVIVLLFNCIEYIPLAGQREVETLDRVLDSFTLYLHHNPLHCGCEEMIAWLQSRGVKNTFAIKCSLETLWLTDKAQQKFVAYYPTSTCDKYIRGPYPYKCSADIHKDKVVKVTTATILGLIAFVVLIVVLKRQSFYLQQWLFILSGLRLYRRGWQHSPFKYDAFVCYCGDDYRWVFQTLVPGLEEDCDPPYSLCVHDRDFIPGRDIADNVMNAMESSRAVILVLSPNSAQSEWCGFEINAVIEERILGSKPLPVIPIILDHVNLQAFTGKQRRMLKKIPPMLADDRKLITKLKFILGDPLTIQEDDNNHQEAGIDMQDIHL